MRPVLIRSIPHTGTFFLFDHLFAAWRPAADKAYLRAGEKSLLHFGDTASVPDGNYLTVAPLRHPVAIAQSWVHRGLDISRLIKLIEQLNSLHVDYLLPIDSPNKVQYLAELASLVGAELKTDWRKINNVQPYKPEYSNAVRAVECHNAELIGRYW